MNITIGLLQYSLENVMRGNLFPAKVPNTESIIWEPDTFSRKKSPQEEFVHLGCMAGFRSS